MHNEWTRYQSFKHFPQSSLVSPIKLAKSGFYYTGTGENTTCFSCGLTVATWTPDETVSEHHARLSPHCLYLMGEDRTNVSIHGDPLEQEDQSASTARNVSTLNSSIDTPFQRTIITGGANGSSEGSLCVSGMRTNQRNIVTSSQPNGHIEYYPGITAERPKHPDYAIKSVRMSSFANWCPDVMDQEHLAEAGFFYTDVQDCVRCFFCDGGMKDWENGDNAWIEHARWFPNCAYVKQVKGENFVSMCRMANIDFMTADGDMQNLATTGFDLEEGGDVVEDQMVEDLNSTAAKLVMGMGYRQEDVENAIKLAREKYGSSEMRAQYILESLLDNSYSSDDNRVQNNNKCTESEAQLEAARNISESKPAKSNDKTTDRNEERQKLLEENRQLRNQMICKICLDKDACIVFLPCGHMVSCVECAHALRKCAVCRSLIQGTVRAYPA